jgi:archaeosine-15-forming tRNA-guanine transglycosylase
MGWTSGQKAGRTSVSSKYQYGREIWDDQENDGYSEAGTGQFRNLWSEGEWIIVFQLMTIMS